MIMKDSVRRQLSLFFVLFQTMGLRWFQGIGLLCLVIIILLNLRNIKYIPRIRKPVLVFGFSTLLLTVLFFKHTDFSFIANIGFILLSSILVILNYRKSFSLFVMDLKKVLTIMCAYSLISYALIVALPGLRFTWYQTWYAHYYTIGYLFWNQDMNDGPFMRMSGAFWEAGCCCFAFNLLLLIFIHQREKKTKISFAVLGVILTYSTAGLFCLVLNFLYYLYTRKKNVLSVTILSVLFAVIAIPFIATNFEDKLMGEHSTSGTVRQRDFAIGITLAVRHPLIGVDGTLESLQNNKEANEIEDAVWLANGMPSWTSQGYMLGGYTNGVFGAFLNYGLILALIIYFQIFRSPLINNEGINKLFFMAIFLAALIGEPLSATTFFFTLALSNWVLPKSNVSSSALNNNYKNDRHIVASI